MAASKKVSGPARKGSEPAHRLPAPEPDLTPHPLVTRLNPEAEAPPDLVVLVGFIGPSKKPDRIRLYLNLSFNAFIDIPVAGIVSTQSVDREDENSPTRVWVRGEAKLEVVQAASQTIEASYLRGRIARDYLRATTPARGLVAPDPGVSMYCMAMNTRLCDSIFDDGGCGGLGAGGGFGGGGVYTLHGSLCLGCYPSYPACRTDECARSINVYCGSHRAVCGSR